MVSPNRTSGVLIQDESLGFCDVGSVVIAEQEDPFKDLMQVLLFLKKLLFISTWLLKTLIPISKGKRFSVSPPTIFDRTACKLLGRQPEWKRFIAFG